MGERLNGAVMTLALPNLYEYLFEVAFDLLMVEDDGGVGGAGDDVEELSSLSVSPSFEVHGIYTLISRYMQYCTLVENDLVDELVMSGEVVLQEFCVKILQTSRCLKHLERFDESLHRPECRN